jgi:hypothetical protein
MAKTSKTEALGITLAAQTGTLFDDLVLEAIREADATVAAAVDAGVARKYPHLSAAQNDALAEIDRRRDAHSASEDSRANREAAIRRGTFRRVK